MKKLLAMVLALVMTLSLAVSANAAFKDVKDIDETYAEAVEVLTGMKVFKGYEDGSFLPKNAITRAEVAAIVYRIYTTDVKDTYVKNYETYNKFADMAGAGWAKGYIGYCANAALVKGYPDGTFKPSGKVTGYEVLAMILRAVGYDKNGEFTGADWALHVAEIAERQGILDNVKGVDLNAPATRELVSELLFQSIQVPMVTYTAAFGYQNVSLTGDKDKNLLKNNATIGYKNFGLICGEDEDKWGRPTKVWANDVNESGKYESGKDSEYAIIAYKADASFQAATAQCDILKELGTKKDVKGDLIVNGQKLDAVTLKDVTGKVGAQGRQLEVFYKYNDAGDTRVVMIDTFLAYVDGTAEAKFDKNGHMTTPYTMTLYVYDEYTTSADVNYTKVVLEDKDEAFTYEEGDYVLVNAYTDKVNSADESGKVLNNKDQYVEVIGKAESFVGAQTKNWYNTYKHTIGDKTYDDAAKYCLDEAFLYGTSNYTWFLDQFGNLIGCADIDNSSYAVLKDIKWYTDNRGEARATLVYMDGTEKTDVIVNEIDGIAANGDFTYDYCELPTEQADHNGMCWFTQTEAPVSTSAKYNDDYRGVALYRVETLKDGDVNLVGFGSREEAAIGHANGVRIDKNTSVIVVDNENLYLNNSTQILIREKDGKDYKYVPATRSTLSQYVASSADIYYTADGDTATRIYIKSALVEKDMGSHLFVTTKSLYRESGIPNTYVMNVVIDGEEQLIYTNRENAFTLAANKGKLFHVTWETGFNGTSYESYNPNYGYVKSVDLVNEAKDTDATYEYAKGGHCDYVTGSSARYKDGTLYSNDQGWTITEDTKFFSTKYGISKISDLEKLDFADEDIGVWVVNNPDARITEASVVYVGTRLSNNPGATLTFKYLKDGETKPTTAVAEWKKSETFGVDYEFNTKLEKAETFVAESAEFFAVDKNATVNYVNPENWLTVLEDDIFVADYKKTDLPASSVGAYVVTAEDGVTKYVFTWKIEDGDAKSNEAALTNVVSANVTGMTVPEASKSHKNPATFEQFPGDITVYNVSTVGSTVTLSFEASEKATIKIASVQDYKDALNGSNMQARANDTITVPNEIIQAGGYVVVEITSESGANVNYYVFQIVNGSAQNL